MSTRSDGGSLHLERDMPASASVVYRALTEPDQVTAWWGPEGFSMPGIELDLRVAGRYRFTMQPPSGEPFHLTGEFREIDPPHRLAYTFLWEEPDPDDVETMVRLSLFERGAATRLVVDQGAFATRARQTLHEQGWSESLQRLERLLTAAGHSVVTP